MKRIIAFITKILLSAFLLTSGISIEAQVATDTAIDFSLKDINNVSHHLFNYLDNNKLVVIDFFTTTCGPCQTYASEISQAFEYFGCNQGNVIFLGINWGSNNIEVAEFDSLWGAHYPSVSGIQGGGNSVVENYQTLSYPTVIVITPNHLIANKHIWPPAYDSIVQEVLLYGGLAAPCTVKTNNITSSQNVLKILNTGELIIDSRNIDASDIQLHLTGLTGKTLFSQQITAHSFTVIRPLLTKGMYIAVLNSNGKRLTSAKILIP